MKTIAAIAWQAGQPLEIEEIDLAGPKDGEVMVRIVATGVCHTDAFTLSGADPEGIFPSILGHEGAGVVVEVGKGVKDLKEGDHVIPLYKLSGSIQEAIVGMTDGGVDYSFECVGSVKLMRAALESCHKGWGESVIIGVAGAGEEIATRPFQLVTGRVWRGSAFGGVKGRTELPGYVDRYMGKQLAIDPFVTHTLPHREINKAFDLMHEGKSIRTVLTYD